MVRRAKPHPELPAMIESGWVDRMIADHYGVSARTVARWREDKGLPCNHERDMKRAEHGTTARYDSGCRCAECRSANAARVALARAERAARGLAPDDKRHGTLGAYRNWRCRCGPCAKAGSEANRRAYVARHGEERKRRPWTEAEDRVVSETMHLRARAVARLLQRTESAIYERRERFRGARRVPSKEKQG